MEEKIEIKMLTDADPKELAEAVAEILDSKKARDIKLLHVEKQTVIADYFVICTGTSRTQIRSLSDEVEYKLSAYGIVPTHVEGADTGVWVLNDYNSVILHVFTGEAREFYKLEKLYQDILSQICGLFRQCHQRMRHRLSVFHI